MFNELHRSKSMLEVLKASGADITTAPNSQGHPAFKGHGSGEKRPAKYLQE